MKHELFLQLLKRDVYAKYQGSVLGVLWSFVNPILLLSVYTFVFSDVFKARLTVQTSNRLEFAITLFAGLLVFNFFSESLSKASWSIVHNPNLVKKVVFPLYLLPAVSVGSAFFQMLVSLLVLMLFQILFATGVQVTIVLLPLIWIPYAFGVLGVSWFISSLSVFIRDVGQMVGTVLMVLMFMCPIFYPISAVPEKYRFILQLNPLAHVIEMSRSLIVDGVVPSMLSVVLVWLVGGMLGIFGCIWFNRTKSAFSDIL